LSSCTFLLLTKPEKQEVEAEQVMVNNTQSFKANALDEKKEEKS
jgi:hypothetical protein